MTGLKAGYIHPDMGIYGHRLVISRYANYSERLFLYNMYSVEMWENGFYPRYKEVLAGFNLQKDLVLGSAKVYIHEKELCISTDRWNQYEGMPQIFVAFFQDTLLAEYKNRFPNIERIRIDMPKTSRHDNKVSFLEQVVKDNEYRN